MIDSTDENSIEIESFEIFAKMKFWKESGKLKLLKSIQIIHFRNHMSIKDFRSQSLTKKIWSWAKTLFKRSIDYFNVFEYNYGYQFKTLSVIFWNCSIIVRIKEKSRTKNATKMNLNSRCWGKWYFFQLKKRKNLCEKMNPKPLK